MADLGDHDDHGDAGDHPDRGPGQGFDPAPDDGLGELLAANQAFYDAFEDGDLDAMAGLWAHGEHVTCVHPGWPALRGWDAVGRSWAALLGNDQALQFILTGIQGRVVGDAGWVVLEENLLDGPRTSTVATVNLFERVADRWRLVAHHGGGVAPG